MQDILEEEINRNWQVNVYDYRNNVIDSWVITDRTEDEAEHEAENDVEKIEGMCDWSLTPIN